MEPMPDDLKKDFEKRCPEFVKMVKMIQDKRADVVLTSLMAFANDPDLLYLSLWYLYDNGITATFGAPQKKVKPSIITAKN